MIPQQFLLSKAEQAGVVYITTCNVGTANIYTGQAATDKQVPCVVVQAVEDGEGEDPVDTGNYWVGLEVFVYVPAPDGNTPAEQKTANDLLVGNVFDAMSAEDIEAQLSAAIPDFTVFKVFRSSPTFQQDGDEWINSVRFRVYCCASTIPP